MNKKEKVEEALAALKGEDNTPMVLFEPLNSSRKVHMSEVVEELNRNQSVLKNQYNNKFRFVVKYHNEKNQFCLYIEKKILFSYKIMRNKDFDFRSNNSNQKDFDSFQRAFSYIHEYDENKEMKKIIKSEFR